MEIRKARPSGDSHGLAYFHPVTAVGKVFCVLLPSLGMMFFPIFTTYVLQEYTHKKGE